MSTLASTAPRVKTTHSPRARKATKKPRFVRRLCNLPTADEMVVRIEERGPKVSKFTHYYVRILPCDFGFATSWEKWTMDGGDGTVHQCNVGGEAIIGQDDDGEPIVDGSPACCCCKGFERFGHCRHIEATRVLLAKGKLTDLGS